MDLNDIVKQAGRLRPTATVVRRGGGDVCVERGELLPAPARREAVAASRRAGAMRGEGGRTPTEDFCDDRVPRTYGLDEMDEAMRELDEAGVVVFRDAIDEDLQKRYVDAMWSWLRRRSGERVLRDDPATWDNASWPNAASPGIQADDGLCHLAEAWEVRERAAPFFEGIYGTSELLVSFDGANVMRPTKGPGGKGEYATPKHWLHVDSDGSVPPESSGYQGVVTVAGMDGTNSEGGAFQAVLGSHRDDFRNFFRDMWSNKSSSLMPLSETSHYTLVPRGHELRARMSRIVAPDRSLIVWKNEVFHCNSPNRSGDFRFAQYVNFRPEGGVPEETRRERREAFAAGIGSTHRVDVFRASSGRCPEFVPPRLSERQKALL